MGVLSWFIVGGIAGYLAGMVVKGDERLGVLGHIFLGIVGGIVGGFIANQLTNSDWMTGINLPTIIVAAIGAVIVVVAYNMLLGRNRTGRGPI